MSIKKSKFLALKDTMNEICKQFDIRFDYEIKYMSYYELYLTYDNITLLIYFSISGYKDIPYIIFEQRKFIVEYSDKNFENICIKIVNFITIYRRSIKKYNIIFEWSDKDKFLLFKNRNNESLYKLMLSDSFDRFMLIDYKKCITNADISFDEICVEL